MTPNKSGLREAIKSKNSQYRLSAEQLKKLNQLQREAVTEQTPNQWLRSRKLISIASLAASLFIVIVLFQWGQPFDHRQSTQIIATEVAKNHLKLKPLDIQTASLDETRRYFKVLDFSISPSKVAGAILSQAHQKLIGGRYCSVKGVTAVQLRYQSNDASDLSTLYQVGYDPELFGEMPIIENNQTPLNLFAKGLSVDMWVERDLLMILVHQQI